MCYTWGEKLLPAVIVAMETQLASKPETASMLGKNARATIEENTVTGRITAVATFADKPLHVFIMPQEGKIGIWVTQFEIIESLSPSTTRGEIE